MRSSTKKKLNMNIAKLEDKLAKEELAVSRTRMRIVKMKHEQGRATEDELHVANREYIERFRKVFGVPA